MTPAQPRLKKNVIASWLKKSPALVRMKRVLEGTAGKSRLDVLSSFPLYLPNSAGKYKDRAPLTIQTINQTFPFLSQLIHTINGSLLPVEDIASFPKGQEEKASVDKLKVKFDAYGSDKANHHNYHHLYGAILKNPDSVSNIFEIGLGTNNTDVVSNMGAAGKPGASLRAFRDYCPNAKVHGADIDKRILFTEERIETFHIDQTDPATFAALLPKLSSSFDLVIDDGLHSPNANIESLRFGLQIVRQGGWVVVEDIVEEAICLWQVVAALLPASRYSSHIFRAEGGIVFAVQRLS